LIFPCRRETRCRRDITSVVMAPPVGPARTPNSHIFCLAKLSMLSMDACDVNSCLECQWSMSVSAAKPSDGGATRRFSRHFKHFFCNTTIGHDQPYFRLDDPRG
ncbi:unnamed protein product, partial [Ectocarpus sp. 8 AP-2014]